MSENDKTTPDHRRLAVDIFNEIWALFDKADRTPDEDRRMLHAAHASLYHWLHAGTIVEEQRGEWMVSRVNAVLGHGDAAVRHAERCAALTAAHAADLKDFDLAFAAEAQARAHAVAGNREQAAEHKARARRLGDAIADPEDKKVFDADFASGDWHSV